MDYGSLKPQYDDGPLTMFKNYISLTKTGIIIGNLIAGAAGFFMAAKGNIDLIFRSGFFEGVLSSNMSEFCLSIGLLVFPNSTIFVKVGFCF